MALITKRYHADDSPLGGVLTSTLTAELEAALASQSALPDPATGLVHLGGGRYYDPALGRPLQPNPVGGPPTAPQALNRYAATSMGPAGMVEGVTGNPLATALWHQVPGTVAGLAIDLAPASRIVDSQLLGQLEISYLPSRGLTGVLSRLSTSWAGQKLTGLPFVGGRIAAKYAARYRRMIVPVRLDGGGTLVDELMEGGTVALSRHARVRLLDTWEVPIVARGSYGQLYFWRSLFKTASVAGLISGGFQLYDDWGNPYLTREQKIERSLLSGFIGFGAALGGGWVGAKIGASLGTATAPGIGTAVGAVVGFGLGMIGEIWIAPQVFEWRGDIPMRKLAPLQN